MDCLKRCLAFVIIFGPVVYLGVVTTRAVWRWPNRD